MNLKRRDLRCNENVIGFGGKKKVEKRINPHKFSYPEEKRRRREREREGTKDWKWEAEGRIKIGTSIEDKEVQ